MPRLRHPSPALIGGIAAALALSSAAPALAQTAPAAAERLLLRPVIDGDPRDLPSFRKPMRGKDGKDKTKRSPPAPSRFNGLPIFGPPPAAGAGTTGYDSLSRSRRKARPDVATRRGGPGRRGPQRSAGTTGFTSGRKVADLDDRLSGERTSAPPQASSATVQPATALPRSAQPAASRPGAYGYAVPSAAPSTMTPATSAVQTQRRRRPFEDDPFASVGIRRGAFLLKPAIELSVGHDSNPGRTSAPTGSSLYIVAPELQAQSLWSRHQLTANVKGIYTGYDRTPSLDRPNLDAKVNGRIDVRRNTRIDLEGRSTISTDTPGSSDLPTDVASLPLNFTHGATAGLAQRFNRFELSAKGTLDRAIYGDATLNNGSVKINKDRNYVQYGGALRGSYELTPGANPFVEIGSDARVHDLAVDRSGFRRDSIGRYVKFGSTFELTRILTGEASLGWLTRSYEDPALADLSGFTADASLVWVASALTRVTLTARSSADESTIAGVSGVLTREAAVQVDYAFRRWLIGTAKLGYNVELYDGIAREDTSYLASVALTYKLSRALWFKGEFRQDWVRSTEPDGDYGASTVLFGLRWQR